MDPEHPETAVIKEAAGILSKGGLVAFPTETVYGLGAAYGNRSAVARLYDVKNRSGSKPFSVAVSRIDMVGAVGGDNTPAARKLMDVFWPGPLTIILNDKKGTGTIGFRFPDNVIARALIDLAGPLVAPSANLSGNASPRTAADVARDLDGAIDMILDGGPARLGTDSTIVDVTAGACKIIRAGALQEEIILEACKKE